MVDCAWLLAAPAVAHNVWLRVVDMDVSHFVLVQILYFTFCFHRFGLMDLCLIAVFP